MAVYVLAIDCPTCGTKSYSACKPEATTISEGWVCEERLNKVLAIGGMIPSETYKNGTPILSEDV